MAESVQLSFESSIHDLVNLEKHDLFNQSEVKTILEKRQEFEYRLKKTNKNQNDFLLYIAYEQSLLKLIRVRSEKLGIQFHKREIEQCFLNHIKRLFEFTLNKFKSDISLWLSYIDFAKKNFMYDLVSVIYFRMLQIHNKPWLWIQYAKFEFEEKSSSETARKIFLKCIAFHPESSLVWHEYFKFELLYCAKIRKRFKLISNFIDARAKTEIVEKQSKDKIWNGSLALMVYNQACKHNKQCDFASKFIEICNKFDFETTKDVKKFILEDLKSRFQEQEQLWNSFAIDRYEEYRQILRSDSFTSDEEKLAIKKKALKETIEVFENACRKFNTPTMWEFFILFRFRDLLENYNNQTTDQVAEILYLLDNLWLECKMTVPVYQQWIKLYHSCFQANGLAMRRLQNLLLDGAERWPNDLNLCFFIACFLTKLPENQKIVQKFFDDSLVKKFSHFDLTNVDVGMDFWELYIDWSLQKKLSAIMIVKICDDLDKILKTCPRKMAEYFKPKILAISYRLYGIKKARNHYEKQKSVWPICRNFFQKMIEIEKHCASTQENIVDYSYVYEDYIHYFGKDDINAWFEYIQYKMIICDVSKATDLYQKAVKCLDSSLCGEFIRKYALFQSSHFKN